MKIEGFLKDIESTLPDPLFIADQTREFREWYKRSYVSAWYSFASGFPRGVERLKDEAERKKIGTLEAALELEVANEPGFLSRHPLIATAILPPELKDNSSYECFLKLLTF